jgi:uncharacterized protein YdhG (YjbR/CyaY superfamily)
MKKTQAQNVDEYLSKLKPDERSELQKIRDQIKKLVPEVEETIAYQMPAYKFKGKPLIYFGAFKEHLSLFPTSGPIERLEPKLKRFRVAKGTIQFTVDNPVPVEILKDLLKERIKQIEETK